MRSHFNRDQVEAVSARSEAETKPLVLVGFMASGKSTVGMLLADRLAVPFVDTDAVIVKRFGMSIAEIFRDQGEVAFRSAERELILGLLSGEPRIIAVGGGAFVDPITRAALATSAYTIWLDPPFKTIQHRLEQCSDRPIAANSSAKRLRNLWTRRRPFYAEANLHIKNAQNDPTLTIVEIIEALERL
ncbi:MAG TPA: shikimate kinase [Sphingomicrobium sp.]|nr:shikimate kinase [Sphingomicrobium sp.]